VLSAVVNVTSPTCAHGYLGSTIRPLRIVVDNSLHDKHADIWELHSQYSSICREGWCAKSHSSRSLHHILSLSNAMRYSAQQSCLVDLPGCIKWHGLLWALLLHDHFINLASLDRFHVFFNGRACLWIQAEGDHEVL